MDGRKKIALIIPKFSGGGAERAVQTIGNYYHNQGHLIYYFLLENSRLSAYTIEGKIVHLGIDMTQLDMWSIFHSASILRKAKKRYGIDIAVSFMEESNTLNVLSKGRERTIISVRTPLSSRSDMKGLLYDRRWVRLLYGYANRIVVVSRFVGMDLIKNYGIRRKICVIPNPALRHEESEQKKVWVHGNKAIVSIGRLEPIKQHDRLIRAFSYIKPKCPEARLIILGDGKLRRYLERICRELNLEDSVVVIGFSQAPGFYLKHARAFVMTSMAEGFPNAMVEAMSYGVPVVTTDSPGGCGEIVGKKKESTDVQLCQYGVLTPYVYGRSKINMPLDKGEIQLGNALLMILNNDEVYREYSERSKRRAEHYSLNRIMGRWDVVLGL